MPTKRTLKPPGIYTADKSKNPTKSADTQKGIYTKSGLRRGLEKERGTALERRVKTKLEKLGWSVTRAAGSHGHHDLVACLAPHGISVKGTWNQRTAYLQIKRDGQISSRERLDLATEAKKAGAEAYLITGDYWVREVSGWGASGWGSR